MSEPKSPDNYVKIDVNSITENDRAQEMLRPVCNDLEQRMAEQLRVLRESEILLLDMTTNVPGVIYQFYVRPNGEVGFYYVSGRSEQVVGLKPDIEGYFERFTELVIPEHRESFIKSIEKAARESCEWKYEGMLQKPTGERIWFSGNSNPSPRKNEIVFNGMVQDITLRKRSEEALLESEERYRTILRTAMDGFWLMDLQGHLLEVNEAYCRMSGYSTQELLSMSVTDLRALETGDDIAAHMQKAIAQGEDRFESRHIRKDGSFFDIEVSIQYRPVEGGQVVVFMRDITERKSMEEELWIKDVAIASSINAFAIADSAGNLTYVNDSFLNLCGYDKEDDVIGKPYTMFWDDEAASHVVANALRQRGQWTGEVNARRKDGSAITVQFVGNIILDSSSNAIGMMASFIDISERKRAEKEVVNLSKFTAENPNPVLRIAKDGTILYSNKGGLSLLARWGAEIGDKAPGRWCDLIKAKFNSGETGPGGGKEEEEEEEEEEGKIFSIMIMPVKESGYANLYARDITKRKKTEEALKESERKLKELIDKTTRSQEELKVSYAQLKASTDDLVRSEKLAYTGRIAASIAHEIRNPLTNVSMSVRQLKKGDRIKPEGIKHSDIIERNVGRINFLITELLNCARPAKLHPAPCDMHRVIKDALITDKGKIKSQKVKVIKILTAKPSILTIDKEYMGRVLLNLITNAIDAMPKGGNLTISTEISKGFFLVKVKDSGIGIPEKDVIKIFDPFFSTKPQGVGLGLTTCYGIIVSHGGTIEVESKWRKGTTFILSLPIEHTRRE